MSHFWPLVIDWSEGKFFRQTLYKKCRGGIPLVTYETKYISFRMRSNSLLCPFAFFNMFPEHMPRNVHASFVLHLKKAYHCNPRMCFNNKNCMLVKNIKLLCTLAAYPGFCIMICTSLKHSLPFFTHIVILTMIWHQTLVYLAFKANSTMYLLNDFNVDFYTAR